MSNDAAALRAAAIEAAREAAEAEPASGQHRAKIFKSAAAVMDAAHALPNVSGPGGSEDTGRSTVMSERDYDEWAAATGVRR
jgi:hypothetical protein